jgi:hypothetical protein
MKTKDNEVLVEDFQHVYEYPEGGYGWIVVLASFIVHVYTIGLNTIFGVYQESYISDPPFEGVQILIRYLSNRRHYIHRICCKLFYWVICFSIWEINRFIRT